MIARIGIVDDHPAIVLGVSSIVNAHEGMRVIVSAPSVPALLRGAPVFDLILLDLTLADGSTRTTNMALLAVTGAPVLAYTVGDRPHLIREAAAAGAIGMLRKSELPRAIVDAVRAALAGETVASADWASALKRDTDFVDAMLTARESEVLAMYAAGETAERVAARLFLSPATVIDHVKRIRGKYAAAGRPATTKVDLFRRAVEDGLLDPES